MTSRLSVIIPTYRRPTSLRLVLNSLLDQHRELLAEGVFEIIVVEGAPLPETAAALADTKRRYAGLPLDILHHTTEAFGYVRKLVEGCELATGDYVFTLTDEDFSQYEFLTAILANAAHDRVFAVPFTGTLPVRKIHAPGYPSYFRHGVPAFPHYVCGREAFARLIGEIQGFQHYVTDHYIPLLCWELGLTVIFPGEFLRVPPLLHLDSNYEGPAVLGPPPDFAAVSRSDRALFRTHWPLARKRAAVERMIDALVAAGSGVDPEIGVARSQDEYFIVQRSGDAVTQLGPYHEWIEPPIEREELARLLDDDRLNTPRSAPDIAHGGGDSIGDPVGLPRRAVRRLRRFLASPR